MKIHSDLIALRRKVGGLKAEKKGGVAFNVKSAKDLMDKLRKAGDELEMVMVGAPVALEFLDRAVDTGSSDSNQESRDNWLEDDDGVKHDRSNSTSTFTHTSKVSTLVTVKGTYRFMSNDGSYVDFVGFGQGGDTQDKAGGKASTYAFKDACVKGLCLPDAELVDTDDEEHPIQPDNLGPPRQGGAPPLGKVLKMFADVKTKADVETARNEVKKYSNWTPDERNQIANAAEKAKGVIA